MHVDHIVPRAAGGQDEAQNLVTSCRDCNLEKSDMLLGPFEGELLAAVAKRNREAGINNKLTIKMS